MVVQARLAGQGVVRGAEHHQLVLAPGQQLQVAVVHFPLDQPQIQIKPQHPVDDGAGVGHLQLHPGAGLFGHITGHNTHRQVVADGQGRPHIKLPQLLMGQQPGLQITGLAQQGLGPGPQLAAQLVEAQALAGALEQLDLELRLKLLERPGGGGLGHAEVIRGAADVFEVSGGEEHLELAEGVAHSGLIGIIDIKYRNNPFYRYLPGDYILTNWIFRNKSVLAYVKFEY